ncbi:signal transduction histidine kinase [Luteibacter sp. Sphag1AF]|uniref:GAF domain-containing sensor histidine kinase n=1 Tax=Luteibacter sp. Sphag1AF TaxID=2587031 RepID=UPI0016078FC4|nr:GAF domain-containing sensor histidine kinase [Luteibacter sp. Sphag1AF]MBB3226515.1 signal transduction histidine kinase [Luteibacter sp. Sphag1AF]
MEPGIAQDIEAVARIAAVPAILEVVAHTTGMRFAAVARVTEQSWVACAVKDNIEFGLKPGEALDLQSTICNEIRQHRQPVIFGHASVMPEFAGHPTPRRYGFESYISIPIVRVDGTFFGTLCALDPRPLSLDEKVVVPTVTLLAQLIATQLDLEERLQASDTALADAHSVAVLREQFIAVVGHDLRSPLHAIRLGTESLEAMALDARARRTVSAMRRSCDRMSDLIDNVLDFARGRLGGGIPLALRASHDLADDLRHVVEESQASHPARALDVNIAIDRPVTCDPRRVAQLLSNLLNNALAHGDPELPVRVDASVIGSQFVLSVSNGGRVIPPHLLARMFQPFSRKGTSRPQPGLGLGLYIASEIARAHGGTLDVASSPELTRFTFRVPCGA